MKKTLQKRLEQFKKTRRSIPPEYPAARGGKPFKLDGSSTRLTWMEDLSGHFRNVTDAHRVIKLGHTGWYLDSFQSETAHGIVLQLPARDGKPVWLHGVADPYNSNSGMVALEAHEWTDVKEDAARWSDRMAEIYAEVSREADSKDQAERQIETARERIAALREDLLSTIRDTRTSLNLKPKVCEAVRIRIKAMHVEMNECRRRIVILTDSPWLSVK